MQDTNVQAEESVGIRCNFEVECNWKWDKTQNDTFQVVNGNNITDGNLTGLTPEPNADNKGDVNGKCRKFCFMYIFCLHIHKNLLCNCHKQ